MKILITGAAGQLGREVQRVLSEHEGRFEVYPLGAEAMDITDGASVLRAVNEIRPDAVVHAAAYTQVDRAESEVDLAFKVNAIGARNVAVATENVGAKLVYISTDYVFDGTKGSPYTEFDAVSPLGVYGRSKLVGEEFVRNSCSRYFIVRTAWLYGAHGNNFVKTMLALATQGKPIKVVNDQVGSPTYALDLAEFIIQLLETENYGVYHATNAGCCSWYEFARAIFAEAGLQVDLSPCTTEEFPRPAPRPAYSVLDHMAIRLNGLKDFRPWQEALRDFISEYGFELGL